MRTLCRRAVAFLAALSLLLAQPVLANTPTPNRGYNEPSVNGDSAVWGGLLNQNFTLLDNNLAGTISTPIINGVNVLPATTAQYLHIILTGSPTSAVLVELPAAGGFWLIDNEITTNQTVTVETVSTSSSGTVVPQGQPTLVFSDGNNVTMAAAQPVGGAPPTGAAGGDLAGNFPNPSVTNTHLTNLLTPDQGGVPAGTILMFAGPTIPPGYLAGDGASYSTTTFARLFGALGYTYGGSGASFNVPDCRARVLAGADTGNATGRLTGYENGVSAAALGNVGGAQSHTQTVAEIAAHTPIANVSDPGFTVSISARLNGPTNDSSGNFGAGSNWGYDINTITSPLTHSNVGVTINPVGSSTPMSIVPPTLIASCIIKD